MKLSSACRGASFSPRILDWEKRSKIRMLVSQKNVFDAKKSEQNLHILFLILYCLDFISDLKNVWLVRAPTMELFTSAVGLGNFCSTWLWQTPKTIFEHKQTSKWTQSTQGIFSHYSASVNTFVSFRCGFLDFRAGVRSLAPGSEWGSQMCSDICCEVTAPASCALQPSTPLEFSAGGPKKMPPHNLQESWNNMEQRLVLPALGRSWSPRVKQLPQLTVFSVSQNANTGQTTKTVLETAPKWLQKTKVVITCNNYHVGLMSYDLEALRPLVSCFFHAPSAVDAARLALFETRHWEQDATGIFVFGFDRLRLVRTGSTTMFLSFGKMMEQWLWQFMAISCNFKTCPYR